MSPPSTLGSIKDNRVKLIPSKELLQFIHSHIDAITELPQNINMVLRRHGYDVPIKIEVIDYKKTPVKLNLADLRERIGTENQEIDGLDSVINITNPESQSSNQTDTKISQNDNYFYLSDLHWLRSFCNLLRKERGLQCYMHEFIRSCELVLPQNEVLTRNPILENRCRKLRDEQQNREYRQMTKNVDAVLKNYPEDTVAYQIKAINSQIIAVLQFVLSVIAGFVFGFLGVNLIIGNLDFGFRLLLGIMCALIIALAEIYFLAKKLNEIDDAALPPQVPPPRREQKLHKD